VNVAHRTGQRVRERLVLIEAVLPSLQFIPAVLRAVQLDCREPFRVLRHQWFPRRSINGDAL
jgi:hypothetical protein